MTTSTAPGMLTRAFQAARYTVTGIKPDTWMSPLQPLVPYEPITSGRQWDFAVGRNLFYTPRGDQRFKFWELRNLARDSEMVRLAIETRQDQMDALEWDVLPIDEKSGDKNDPRIKEIKNWLAKPDGIHDWQGWLRVILEELYVTDAVTLLPRFTRGGGFYGLDLMDGTTIFPIIDENGRQPQPPNPAYQQILKGVPKVDYTSDELLYLPRKVQINTPYGYSAVEQIAMSAKTDMERIKYQLAYFTEGSMPDTYMTAPENMTADQIKMFEEHFNATLAGNPTGRRQVPIVPNGMEMKQLKEPDLKNDFDEWIWRKVALAFKLAPTPLIKQMNRSSSEADKERGEDEGLAPIMVWTRRLINSSINKYFGFDDLQFIWAETRDQNPQEAADIDAELVRNGILTINEVRQSRGLAPVDGGDTPMLATATGYVPINQPPAPQPVEGEEPDDTTPGNNDSDPDEDDARKITKKKPCALYGTPSRSIQRPH